MKTSIKEIGSPDRNYLSLYFISGETYMSKLVVLVCGGAGHGKDTISTYLREHVTNAYPYHLAFADIIKEQATYLGWDGTKDIGGRQFLIEMTAPIKKYGNWLASKYPESYKDYSNDNYYTSKLYEKIKNSDCQVFFISDFRYECEYSYFMRKRLEGEIDLFVIRVTRFDSEGNYYIGGLTKEQLSSPSETEWKSVAPDFSVVNDGTLDTLYNNLDSIVNTISER